MIKYQFKNIAFENETKTFKGTLEYGEKLTKEYTLVFSEDFEKVSSGTILVKDSENGELT